MASAEKKIIIIAGPNGAGKTTFAEEFLTHEAKCPNFVNADLIAKGLAPFASESIPFKASRLMLAEINSHVRKGDSFAFETTLSGRLYARLISQWQGLAYKVKLLFIKLELPELAVERVKLRVQEGGHNIPEAVIRRRFVAGLQNLEMIYKPLVNEWRIYDNSYINLSLLDEGVKQ
ncbi:MAG: AAA family ATPase [Gammaproteobacteria bacterium]